MKNNVEYYEEMSSKLTRLDKFKFFAIGFGTASIIIAIIRLI